MLKSVLGPWVTENLSWEGAVQAAARTLPKEPGSGSSWHCPHRLATVRWLGFNKLALRTWRLVLCSGSSNQSLGGPPGSAVSGAL